MQFKTLIAAAVLAVTATHIQAASIEEQIRTRLEAINPQIQVLSVKPSPINGVMEVALNSGETLFTSETGEYFLLGQLYQAKGNSFVNLSEQRKKGFRADALKALNTDDMVVFKPSGEVKATVYAFTDVDCGYCRKLHSEMSDYLSAGIEIRYLAFPRAGVNSVVYNKMVSVWCADDRQTAMTQSKQGITLPAKTCDNPVAAQYELGQQFGVNGTPALVFEDGSLMPGYVPAERLAAFLEMN
ncbi:MAG TPA: DsbC family protein [Motiliproteus sp.]